MCNDAVWGDPSSLQYVPGWFVTQQQLKAWHDYNGNCNDDELIKQYEGYQNCKPEKAQIKEELIPIAWNPDHVMDRFMLEDKKRSWK